MSKDHRYCVNGHDTAKVGRRKDSRGCNECVRIRQRLYMRAFRKGERLKRKHARFPKAPLIEAILAAAPRYQSNQAGDKGYRGLAKLYASRFPDTSHEAAERMINRLMHVKSKYVEEETADRWCVVLGIHPIALWPSEWPLEEAEA